VPCILEGNDKSAKNVFLDPEFFAYVLGVAFEEFKDPCGTSESRIMIGTFIVVCLCIIENCEGSGHHCCCCISKMSLDLQ